MQKSKKTNRKQKYLALREYLTIWACCKSLVSHQNFTASESDTQVPEMAAKARVLTAQFLMQGHPVWQAMFQQS